MAPTDAQNFDRIRELLDEIRRRLDTIESSARSMTEEAPTCPRTPTQ